MIINLQFVGLVLVCLLCLSLLLIFTSLLVKTPHIKIKLKFVSFYSASFSSFFFIPLIWHAFVNSLLFKHFTIEETVGVFFLRTVKFYTTVYDYGIVEVSVLGIISTIFTLYFLYRSYQSSSKSLKFVLVLLTVGTFFLMYFWAPTGKDVSLKFFFIVGQQILYWVFSFSRSCKKQDEVWEQADDSHLGFSLPNARLSYKEGQTTWNKNKQFGSKLYVWFLWWVFCFMGFCLKYYIYFGFFCSVLAGVCFGSKGYANVSYIFSFFNTLFLGVHWLCYDKTWYNNYQKFIGGNVLKLLGCNSFEHLHIILRNNKLLTSKGAFTVAFGSLIFYGDGPGGDQRVTPPGPSAEQPTVEHRGNPNPTLRPDLSSSSSTTQSNSGSASTQLREYFFDAHRERVNNRFPIIRRLNNGIINVVHMARRSLGFSFENEPPLLPTDFRLIWARLRTGNDFELLQIWQSLPMEVEPILRTTLVGEETHMHVYFNVPSIASLSMPGMQEIVDGTHRILSGRYRYGPRANAIWHYYGVPSANWPPTFDGGFEVSVSEPSLLRDDQVVNVDHTEYYPGPTQSDDRIVPDLLPDNGRDEPVPVPEPVLEPVPAPNEELEPFEFPGATLDDEDFVDTFSSPNTSNNPVSVSTDCSVAMPADPTYSKNPPRQKGG